ncbi:glycoside hydrolase family 65 protein [Phytoactinopolyspora alkaliphila]|uniref:Glycoside hydrolase family 65 protein n=1 Tax=Phytoactinopolyspora alkaliphila TaxID=1783498 RepID=A0A6N9YPV5_9ACTN|nr:glycoside hydrolase family 65 protein [Phytoactinopolyspora alkaliphila]NED96878.1 glycoside hydrolase family 65 protein [Phytoactinopolyspora alkaliphila]
MIDRSRFPVDPWRLIETCPRPGDDGVTETLFAVGNGYLGLRGNHPEGDHAHEHGTFINGLHETWPIRHAERAYGFAEVGQTIVNVPDAKGIRVHVDDEAFSLADGDIREYQRTLDLREGVLSRRLLWVTSSGKEVLVEDDRLVSFTDRNLAIMRLEVTVLNADAAVIIDSLLVDRCGGREDGSAANGRASEERLDPRRAERLTEHTLRPAGHRQDDARSVLCHQVATSRMRLAVAAHHVVETENDHATQRSIEPSGARHTFVVRASAGVPTRVTKLVSYHTAARQIPPDETARLCERTLDRTLAEGINTQYVRQQDWLRDFWERSDVQIPDHDDLQQAIRWCLFHLAQAGARADGLGVSAKGVTGSGYGGHYFWDTEIYVLPFFTYTTPVWSRNALRTRILMLPAARCRAKQLNEEGALFPWRTINGEEASAYYAAGTAQYHINADITYALAQYVRATGDAQFLYQEGVDILVETARLWVTLGFWRRQKNGETFHIHGVTGPDEYTTVVDDNLFTNVMARFNLRYAARTIREMATAVPDVHQRMADRLHLDPAEPAEWERAAEAMHIPFNSAFGIHPQDSRFLEREVWDLEHTDASQRPLLLHFHPLVIYRFQVLKQADVVLALFLHGDQFASEEKLADFEYYDPLTTGDSTLSAVVQSVLAAEVGYRDLALEYFTRALYVDLADLHHNTADGVHVASAGGVWTALVCGFGGMRDHGGQLTFDPRLPAAWPKLSYPLCWRGTRLTVSITRDELRVRVLGGGSVSFGVRGVRYTATPGDDAIVPLADQGPVRSGRPLLKRVTGMRRQEDIGSGPDNSSVGDTVAITVNS